MNTPQKRSPLVALFVVIILVVGGLFLYQKVQSRRAGSTAVQTKTADPYVQELEANRKDLESYLAGRDVDPAFVYRGAIQLGEIKDPLALKAALKMKSDPSRYLREGAAQTVGYFQDADAMPLLKELLLDKEPSVRAFAMQAIGRVSTPARSALIDELLAQKKLSDEEQVALRESYYRNAPDSATKAKAIASLQLLSFNASPSLMTAAALKMCEIAPDSEATKEVLHKKIAEGTDGRVMGVGIRLLASQQDEWIKSRLGTLASHPDPLVRKAVIQSLHRICPANRWTILNQIIAGETDASVIEVAIDEPLIMPEPEAESFYTKALEVPKVKEYALERVKKSRDKLHAEHAPDPCR